MPNETFNLANAAVIIGCLYFLITQELGNWAKIGIILILLFAIFTWGIYHTSEKEKQLINTQVKELESRIRLNNSNAAFTSANALLLKEQALWLKSRH